MHEGGGVYFGYNDGARMGDCVLAGNSAGVRGGAIALGGVEQVEIVNCTATGNSAPTGGAVFSEGTATFANNIFWGDSPDEIAGPGALSVHFCDVQGGFPGPGNVDADPLFSAPPLDPRLQAGSPCIDAGHNWAVSPDVADLDSDGDTSELTPLDFDSNPRFVHAPAQHPGCGEPVVVDMGAYEFQDGKAAEIILGDIDGDGSVGAVDLAALLAAWGDAGEDCFSGRPGRGRRGRDQGLAGPAGNWGEPLCTPGRSGRRRRAAENGDGAIRLRTPRDEPIVHASDHGFDRTTRG